MNTVEWSGGGEWIVTGSDDMHVNLYSGEGCDLRTRVETGHLHNIFSAKLVPDDYNTVVCCGADGQCRMVPLVGGESTLLYREPAMV